MIIGSHRSGTNMLSFALCDLPNLWYANEALQVFKPDDEARHGTDAWRATLMHELFGKNDFPYYLKHPEHRSYAQIPGQWPALRLLKMLIEDDAAPQSDGKRACLTKVLFQHHPCSFDTWLNIIKLPVNIIYMKRHNLLDIIISLQVAYRNRFWKLMHYEDHPGDTQVRLQPVHVLEEFCFLEHQYSYFDRWLLGFDNVIYVDYDRLSGDWETESKKIVDFMGYDHPVHRKTQKQIRRSQSETVENYDEIKQYFRGTRWYGYFKD